MAPGVLAHVFDPFFTTKPATRGTGLGLAMVHGLVTQQGGKIVVDSRHGTGTTFTITLPLVQAPLHYTRRPSVSHPSEHEAVSMEGTSPLASRRPPRVLFCDDEAAILSLGKRILERNGYDVTVAYDGASGEAALLGAAEPFDLIVTDVYMPNGGGGRVLGAAQRLQPTAGTIAVSGNPSQLESALEPGIPRPRVINKPWSSHDLLTAIESVLAENPQHE